MLLVGGLTDEEQNNEHCYILDTPGLHRLTVHLRNYCLPVNNPKTVLTKDTDSFQLKKKKKKKKKIAKLRPGLFI